MTGAQVLSSDSNVNAIAAPLAGHLSDEWSDADMIRAIVRAIPANQRQAALSAIRSLVGVQNDTVVGH